MKVPVYGQQQVAPAAPPEVRQELDYRGTNGEAVAQGLQQLGQGVERGADEFTDTRTRARALEATNGATQLQQHLAHVTNGVQPDPQGAAGGGTTAPDGSPAPPPRPPGTAELPGAETHDGLAPEGILNAKGMKAINARLPTLAYGEKVRADIAQGLTSDEARQMFMEHTDGVMLEFHKSVEDHTARQVDVVHEEGLKAAVATHLNAIANAFTDPAAVAAHLAAVDGSILKLALSPEIGAEQVKEWHQEAYRTVIEQHLANKDWKGAQAAFSQHGNEMGYGKGGAEERTQLEHKIVLLKEQQQGEELGQSLVAGARDPSGKTDIPAAITAWEKTPAEQRTEEAKSAFHAHLGLAVEANHNMAVDLFETASSAWVRNHNLNDVPADLKERMQSFDSEGWFKLEERDREWKARQAAAARGHKLELTDDQANLYATMKSAMLVDRPGDFRDVTPEALSHGLTGKLPRAEIRKLQDVLLQSKGKKPPSDKSLTAEQSNVIIQVGRDSNVLPEKGSPATLAGPAGRTFTHAEEVVQQKRAAEKARTGKEPSLQQIQAWASAEFAPVKAKGTGLFGSNVFATSAPAGEFESNPDFRGKSPIVEDAVPEKWATAIRKDLAVVGISDPSDEEVATAYKAKMAALDRGPKPSPAAAAPAPAAPPATSSEPEQLYTPADQTPASTPAPAPEPAKPAPRAPQPSLVHPTIQGVLKTFGNLFDDKGMAPKTFATEAPKKPDEKAKPTATLGGALLRDFIGAK